MAERERSRSPEPAADNPPPADDTPAAEAPAADTNGNGDSGEAEGVKLYVGNLDYGKCGVEPYSVW